MPARSGLSGNIYCGLMEFEEMMFVLHYLRENDLFIDVGANVGVYSLLASGLTGCRTIAFEPVPSTYHTLNYHVAINDLAARIECINKAVGDHEGTLCIAIEQNDCLNHVVVNPQNNNTAKHAEIDVTTLDRAVTSAPSLIKMDIEGYELLALKGAAFILRNPALNALIIEVNENIERYAVKPGYIIEFLESNGYHPYSYNPLRRSLAPRSGISGNAIFIKDASIAQKRLQSSRSFSIYGNNI